MPNLKQGGVAGNYTLGKMGPRIRDASGTIEARDNADTAYTKIRAAAGVGANDVVTVGQLGNAALFGRDAVRDVVNTLATTTLSSFQTYRSFTTPALPLGTYAFLGTVCITGTRRGTEIQARALLNGSPTSEVYIEPRVANSIVPVTYLHIEQNISGPQVVEIQYAKENGPGAAGIKNSTLAIWRFG